MGFCVGVSFGRLFFSKGYGGEVLRGSSELVEFSFIAGFIV